VTAFIAAAWDAVPLLLWAAAVGSIAGLLTAWVRSLRSGVDVDIRFEPARVFIGEPATVHVRIVNARRFPIPIVRLVLPLPEGLLAEAEPAPTAFRGHRRRLTVGARSETSIALPVFSAERGEYWLDGITLDLGDVVDLAPVRREIRPERPLLVMPRVRGRSGGLITRSLPFGRPMAGALLFEDREHFAGVRDYAPGDPMHHVHWRASAHTGSLQTKKFEPTRSAEILLAVDLSIGEPFWHGVDAETAELTIAWAASVARRALHAGWRTGLVANTHLRRGRGPLLVRPSTAAGHEAALFAALARMPAQPTNDLGPVLREHGRGLARRTSVVVVSSQPGPSLRHEMHALRRRGIDVVHLVPGDEEARTAS
jgi:uncharacterized protein (DUF58 family)